MKNNSFKLMFKSPEIPEFAKDNFTDYYAQVDKIMVSLMFAQWFIATVITAMAYDTYLYGFIAGGIIAVSLYAVRNALRGTQSMQILVGISMMMFSVIFIQQHLGRIEMHFHVFIAMAVLAFYKNTTPIFAAAATTILHHLIFNYLQYYEISLFGMPVMVFNYGCGLDIVLLHGVMVVIEAFTLAYLVRLQIEHSVSLDKAQREVEILNTNLSKMVMDELAKNREKDVILQKQSRLAAVGEMIGNISHQWRQPLNALAVSVQDLPMAYSAGEVDNDYLVAFKNDSMNIIKYMSNTIDDFRNFFRPDKEKSQFNVKDAIESALSLVNDSLRSAFINLDIRFPDEPSYLLGYPNEFSQTFLNIINNAKDALKENNRDDERNILITATKYSDCIKILVEDNAGGIPQNIMDKIFDPYFTTKHASQGTGIGLYMAKMIIEQNMDGKLNVYNTSEGACFEIVLTCQ